MAQPEIMKPRNLIKTGVGLLVAAGVILINLFLVRFIFYKELSLIPSDTLPAYLGIWGIGLIIAAIALSGVKIVQSPEVWIIERFGAFQKALEPRKCPYWLIPFVETVRAKPRTWEQPVPIFSNGVDLDFRDDSVTLKDPKAYVKVLEENPEKVIYELEDWPKWIEDNLEPIIRGYLNGLSLDQALDRGLARGDLLARIKEAPEVLKKEIEKLEQRIKGLSGEDEVKSLKESMEEEARKLDAFKGRIEDEEGQGLKKDLDDFRKEAKEKSLEIMRVVIADFGLSEDTKKARAAVQKARRELESAQYEADKEAVMRTQPILKTMERLKDMGFPEEESREKAYVLDVVETLAKNKQMFLTSGGKEGLDVQGIIAQLSAIASRASQASKE